MTNNLIEALEKAEGPSRELDEQIAKVLGLFPSSKDWRLIYKKERIWRRFPYGGDKYTWKEQWEPECYTASIDAALTLVPDGYLYEMCSKPNGLYSVMLRRSVSRFGAITGDGKSQSIALCIAALRAIGDDHER